MRTTPVIVSQIRSLYRGSAVAGLSDRELVERFAVTPDDASMAAFSAIVDRHGAMVMRVCRGSLRDDHDADDAFQAVFLVLVHKARSLWVRDSLGPWLHQVAVRTSASLRAQKERRRIHEQLRGESTHASEPSRDPDLDRVIHEELGRLPDRYREAMVLCDLEGLSHEEAAARLGWPVGTVKSRQARGRDRLRDRLARRGLAPTNASFATALALRPPSVEVVAATNLTAQLLKLGPVMPVSASVRLATLVLRGMMMRRITFSVLSIVAVGTIAIGGVAVAQGLLAAEQQPPGQQRTGPMAAEVPAGPRPPAGSLFEMRIAADLKHDADAIGKPGYRWVKVDPRDRDSLDDLVVRVDDPNQKMILVKLDPQNLTERDLLEVKKTKNEREEPAIFFRLTSDGAKRFGALTRAHLPEEGGNFKYRLALIVEGAVFSTPSINSEIREAGIIEYGRNPQPAEIDRMIKKLAEAASFNTPPLKTKAVKDQAEAIREAKLYDLPALDNADIVAIETPNTDAVMRSRVPKTLERFRKSLQPREVPPSGGMKAATIHFLRGNELIRSIWVYEGGEWGFERPGTSWTTGSDPELWGLVKQHLLK